MDVAGHTFVITGGSSGLGAACARRLAGAGGNVALVDQNATLGEALAAELGSAARFLAADVCDDEQSRRAVDLSREQFGRIDGLVQCAGIAPAGRVVAREGPGDLALFQRVIQVNLVGTFNMLRLAAAAMAENPPQADGARGIIVNTSSAAAFEGQIGQAAYAASKAGVAGMTLPIARELARFGIRVVAIAPGIFDTPMMAGMAEPVRQSLGAQVPFPSRLGRADEFAALAEHIVRNAMLNGCVIRLDGALRMGPK